MSGTMRPSTPGSGLPGGPLALVLISMVLAALVVVAALRGGGHTSAAPTDYLDSAGVASSAGTGMPPWPAPTDPAADVQAAGLALLSSEGTADHYHAHLDIIVNGTAVPVAAGIGIDETARTISPLHTHDATGVIHIEAPSAGSSFYLGQLFIEWNVALSADSLGGLKADGTSDTLTAYVDGEPFTGDPATIKLTEHQEIALVFGPPNEQVSVPSTYDFATL